MPISDKDLKDVPFYRPPEDSPEMRYLRERRAELGGSIPARRATSYSLPAPAQSAYASQLKGSGKREISTTMAFVRVLSSLVKDKQIGQRVVPIVPDEARTFGMEGMFRQLGIYSSVGQQYTPHDAGQILYYKEEETGQILEEGINEAGAMACRRYVLLSIGLPDGALLHLLFNVRLPENSRFGVGRWRQSGARISHWRYGRSNDAEWRGSTAPGWAQPLDGNYDSQLHFL